MCNAISSVPVTLFVSLASGLKFSQARCRNLWWGFLGVVVLSLCPVTAQPAPAPEARYTPVPLMAYYYIWYDETSWDRAKTDYPKLGRYSSDDREVLAQHMRWAKEAGIDGFIVSWKSTPVLNRRLDQLLSVAAAEQFAVWVIYQGLDFYRKPLPVTRIDRDLKYFSETYTGQPALGMFDRPVVIWSGTWAYSVEEVTKVAQTVRDRLYLLASERNLKGYLRLAEVVAGNAYYWSSVNPETFPGYLAKLSELGRAVHEHGGLWVAPAAPGFDARLVGGTTVVERRGGETLRQQLGAALRSSPDAIGLISWNEFSENSHVEPSETYGTRALEQLANRNLGTLDVREVDSSDPGTTDTRNFYGLAVLGALVLFVSGSVALAVARQLGKKPEGNT